MPGQDRLVFADVGGDLVFEGLIGLIDPPREEAIAAVAECRSAGIAVKMITGDHVVTAEAIARQLGLDVAAPPPPGSLDTLDERVAAARTQTNVFARTTPEQKLRLVEALQACGNIVAMTGRRRQRCAGAEARRRRRRHGTQRNRSRQGSGRDGARGRQLCFHRRRRSRRACRLRQSYKGHRLDAADERRRDLDHPARHPVRHYDADHAAAGPMGQHRHRRSVWG